MEISKEELAEIISGAVKSAVDEIRKDEPAQKSAGVAVVKDEADKGYPSVQEGGFGQFLKDVFHAATDKGAPVAPKLMAIKAAVKATGASEGVGSDSGFLVQTDHSAKFLENTWASAVLSSRAMRDPISGGANSITMYGLDETSRADGSRWGGIRGYRLAEGGTMTASRPSFRLLELKLKKYGVLAYGTDEMLADTALWARKVMELAPKELGFMLDDDVMNGLGTGGPTGILNSPALIQVSKETGQAAATIVYENIVRMWARRLGASANYVWLINQDCEPQLDMLAQAVGTGAIPARFVDYGPEGALRIKGRPVISTEFNQTLGTMGDLVLANVADYYQIVDKDGIQAASSIHVQFLTDEQVFRFIYRCDGIPTLGSAITPYKGSNTLSPFVALATRA